MSSPAAVVELASELTERGRRAALDLVRLTPPQRAFIADPAAVALWRGANQVGKSTSLALDAIHRSRGTHPLLETHRPPVKGMVVGVSYEQMVPLMERLWQLAPKDELDPKCGFEPGRGITGKPPRLHFVCGPGAGSVIGFATYKQGPTRLAGATIHFVTLDEPPPESFYGEVMPRLVRHQGHIRIGMTPTPDMPDQSWLRELVAAGQVSEHNCALSEANCWPEGDRVPWLWQDQVDEFEASLLEVERGMRMRGDWEPMITGRWLSGFTSANVLEEPGPPADAIYGIGVDHGTAAGKQRAVLIAVAGRGTPRPRVWFLDEYTPAEVTTPRADAEGIVRMLARNDLEVDCVELWVGDIQARSRHTDAEKSNKTLRRELAELLDRQYRAAPRIAAVRKFAGSVGYGLRQLNTLFVQRDTSDVPQGLVHPRCVELRKACERFAGDTRDPLKDVLDAARYVTERAIGRDARVRVSAR